jgi:TatD DNase family protein
VIDTHAHVHSRAFDKDRDDVLRRTWESGSRYLVEVNISAGDWPRVRELASGDPRIFVTLGIHPHDASREGPEDLDRLFREITHPKVRAIGETGLDYYRDYAPHDIQRELFRLHVAKARETGLPLVVHSRAAHEDTLCIIEEEGRGKVRGVMHCFSGDQAIARRARDLGFLLGFGGTVTYNPARAGTIIRAVGLDAIVLETDCPYLTPAPRRNDRNEPANIPVIAESIAKLLEIEVGEVESATDSSAIRLFGLDG